jgi:hypothetical protein
VLCAGQAAASDQRASRRRVRPAGEARPGAASRAKPLCPKTPRLPVGEAFASECAPATASAVEAQLRHDLAARLEFTPGLNAVRVARPFFEHLEVWPDIVIPELRIAVEYDSTGRHGLEHVGKRQDADLRKDRALRWARWEVVRIRTGRLERSGRGTCRCPERAEDRRRTARRVPSDPRRADRRGLSALTTYRR